MYTKLVLMFLFSANFAVAQYNFKLNKKRYFTISTFIDPGSSIKENGLDIVGEIEYVGLMYVKAGFESFSVLTGGYQDIHGAIGINFTAGSLEKTRFYTGCRIAKVNRGHENAYRINYGLESGVDYNISNKLFIGLRSTIDLRRDQEIFGWTPERKFSGFLRIGYQIFSKS